MIIDVCDVRSYPKEFIELVNCGTFTEEEAYQTIKNCSLLSFHYTRLYDNKKIIKEGLKKFNYSNNTKYVLKIYKKVYRNAGEVKKIKEMVFEYQKYFPDKEEKLCFICGASKKTEEYLKYYSAFGGECISNAIKQDNNIYNNLIKIGDNYCVKFLVPVEYIKQTNVGEQIYFLIGIMKNNYLMKKGEPYEGYLYGYNISPKLIQSVDLISQNIGMF